MRRHPMWVVVVAVFGAFAVACGDDVGADEFESGPRLPDVASADEGAGAPDGGETDDEDGDEEDGDDDVGDEETEAVFTEEDLLDVNSATFSDPTTVDNTFFPLVPGTRHVYEGTALDDDELIDRKVISIVTDLTKEINGVDTVVLWERDFDDDLMIESEIAFFAQDDDGNVWHFGQYRETYDEDEFVGGRVWVVDIPAGSRGGIVMHADPQPGPSYSQGWAPAPFNWTDRAAVDELDVETCIDDDTCFEGVLVTEESDDENPGASQLKYYAPGIGNVQVGFRGPDPEEEEMVMTEDVVLTGAELDEVRAEALALEERASMYSLMPSAQPRS